MFIKFASKFTLKRALLLCGLEALKSSKKLFISFAFAKLRAGFGSFKVRKILAFSGFVFARFAAKISRVLLSSFREKLIVVSKFWQAKLAVVILLAFMPGHLLGAALGGKILLIDF